LCCREKHGDYFGIGVAGYPEAHPDFIVDDEEQMKKNYWDSLAYLKEKVRHYVTLLIIMLYYESSQPKLVCSHMLMTSSR
jgi:methylenetetrahydrofolate reductase (NADPH)